jgi:electron transfer flavoprotein-quinone oxidoreductase
MGDVTGGKFGGGFLYTNKESISLGIVVGIEALTNQAPEIKAPEMLDKFKQRPEIARLIKGGETVEYSAHVIPEGGLKAMGSQDSVKCIQQNCSKLPSKFTRNNIQ